MNVSAATAQKAYVKRFRSPATVIARFVAKRTYRGAAIWALILGTYVASKAIGLVDLYPTTAARAKIAASYGSNVGIEFLLGSARHVNSSAGSMAAWATLGAIVIVLSIWALLLATRYFRGEEDSGRTEMLLAGQTTARRSAVNVLAGLGASLLVFYTLIAVIFIGIGRSHGIDFNTTSALFFALAAVSPAVIFLMVGALASQLMPTRARAAMLSAFVFGLTFLLRAVGDITSAHWLLYITPFGWMEKLQPLSGSQPVWLLPIIGLVSILGALTIYFAGKRDLGDALVADEASAKSHNRLLNSPLGAAMRLTRTNALSWLAAIFATSFLYGMLTKSVTQEFNQSSSASRVLNRIAHQSQVAGTDAFFGIIFLLMIVVFMAYAASAIVAIRRDEAQGYLDNFFVRPVSRLKWLSGRITITASVVVVSASLTLLGIWFGAVSQHADIPFHQIFLASVNATVPVWTVVGAGVFVFGIMPRMTSLAVYGLLAWSFLIEMVSSGVNINHWILDTSVLHQITLAPAANPNWNTDFVVVLISIIFCIVGALSFKRRDLEAE